MAKIIKVLHDSVGNDIFPMTSLHAVIDSSGNSLDKILDGYGLRLDEFEDYELKEDNTKVDPPSLYIALKNIRSGTGVSNALSNIKASLLSMNDNMNELGNILESKNKSIIFYDRKELDSWLFRRKSILNKGDLLLTTVDKDYWWDGENLQILKSNISQSQIDEWDSILKKSKEYTDNVFSNLVDIEIKIVNELPIDPATNTLYIVKEKNAYREYMYINSTWIDFGETKIELSNMYTKDEIDTMFKSITTITGKEYQNSSLSISQPGWYRLAKFKGYTNILKNGSFANGCNIIIRKRQVTSRSELYNVEFISTNSRKQFILNNKSTSSDQDITYLRNVYNTEENISYIDFYYNGSTGNDIYFEINNIVSEYSKDVYKWEIYKEVKSSKDIDETNIEICTLDLTSISDINSRLTSTESSIKSLTSILESLVDSGDINGDITINGGVSEEDLERVKEETVEELFPIGSFSFQKYPIGTWEEVISFSVKNEKNEQEEKIVIYKRIT